MNLATILMKNIEEIRALGALYDIFVDLAKISQKFQIQNKLEKKAQYQNPESVVTQNTSNSRMKEALQFLISFLWKCIQSVFHTFNTQKVCEVSEVAHRGLLSSSKLSTV